MNTVSQLVSRVLGSRSHADVRPSEVLGLSTHCRGGQAELERNALPSAESYLVLSLSRKHATKRIDVDWLMSCLAFWPSCGTKRSLWRLKLGLVLRLRVRRWVVDVVVYSAPYSLRGEIGSLICAGVRNLSAMGVSSVGVLSWTPMVAS